MTEKDNAKREGGFGYPLLGAVVKIFKEWDHKNRGWYYGLSALIDDLYNITGKMEDEKEVKKILRKLVKEKILRCEAIFDESNGKLNGRGYFYNGV
jgi:hypothetical protein